MKKIIIIFIINALYFSVYSQNEAADKIRQVNPKAPEITFERLDYDFGKVPYGSKVEFKFVFKNTGKEPLVLSNVKASCGCTTPVWSKEPVLKKDTSSILVKYDSKRVGPFNKQVMVYSNAVTSPVVLNIKGEIEKNPNGEIDDRRMKPEGNSIENPQRIPENK